MRRRAARDVENAHRFALERFAADLLAVADSLEKAVESATSAQDVAAVAEGVQLSLKLFLDTMRKNGIEQVDPLGEPFDPSEQEAMAVVVNPDSEPNSVTRGYSEGLSAERSRGACRQGDREQGATLRIRERERVRGG